MYTVLLYYKFTRIANPEKEVVLHTEVCTALDLKGRVLMNEEGLNGTVAGTKEATELYKAYMQKKRIFRGKKIVMFCTGGIRCEPASSYFLSKGFDQKFLYQLEGGIVKYAEKYGNEGFYEGKCFVFDDRMAVPVNTSESATIVGNCLHCQTTTDVYRNCANKFCNKLFLGCEACVNEFSHTCSAACKEVVLNPDNVRPFSVPMMHRNKV